MQPSAKETIQPKPGTDYYYHHPAISILLPFDTATTPREKIQSKIDDVVKIVKDQITNKYTPAKALPVVEKLMREVSQLNYDTSKKAIALFISPIYSKLLYLDIPTETKVVIDEPYEIRDLVYSEQHLQQYLVLVVCAERFRILSGNYRHLEEIEVNAPTHVIAYTNDIAERVTNFSDISGRKEVMLDKFLHHIDEELSNVLKSNHLPVIVLGAKRTAGHFNKISHNTRNIIEYVHGSYDDATLSQLRQVLQPHFASLRTNTETEIAEQLADAMDAHKLAWGIHETWRYAMQGKGRLLLIEKTFRYPANDRGPLTNLSDSSLRSEDPSHLKDAVDVLIEKVMETGGKVQFVDKGLLENYESIALVQRY